MSDPQPDPTQMTDAELDQAIIATARAYIAARIARLQIPQTIADTYAWLQELTAERDSRAA